MRAGGNRLEMPGGEFKRVYWTYGVPGGTLRGGHAHRELAQTLTCPYGSVEIFLDDGERHASVVLDDPNEQLYVGPMVWHDMLWREEGSVLLVGASDYYAEEDYIRQRDVFDEEVRLAHAGAVC